MRATVHVKEKFSHKWIFPLIIFVVSIILENFLGPLLYFHSYKSIMAVQNFMNEKIKLSIFNNTFIKDDETHKIDEESGSAIFCLIIQILNSNLFYFILCAIISNFVNSYKSTILIYSLFLANFISAALCFIFHSPRPFMSYYSIKPAIIYNDWGSPDIRIVTLISFYLTFYEIIIRNKIMNKSIAGKIIVFFLLFLFMLLDIFFIFSAGDLGYNQIIFSIFTGIVTYMIIFFIFKVDVNNTKQFYNFIKFNISYYLFINLILIAFQFVLFLFIIDKWDKDFYKAHIDEQQKRVFYPEFFTNFFNFRQHFYLDKGNFNNVICFAMNIICFLSLKIELYCSFKGDYNQWSRSNFEYLKGEKRLLDYQDEEFFEDENTQWNHTPGYKTFIRVILTIIFCAICLVPTVIIYAIFKVENNDAMAFIFITAIPLLLMTFGIFYLFKIIFRCMKLAQKK